MGAISRINTRLIVLIAVFTIVVSFWYTAHTVNVYEHAVTGALFELMALPFVALAIAVPVVAVIYWHRQKWSVKSPFLYLAIFSIAVYIGLISSAG